MDLQTLSNLFATTYNPDPNVRKAAELQIRKVISNLHQPRCLVFNHNPAIQVGGEEGMVAALLQIIAYDNVDLYVSNALILRIHASFMLTDHLSSVRLAKPALFISRIAWPHLTLSLTHPDSVQTRHLSPSLIAMRSRHPSCAYLPRLHRVASPDNSRLP